MPQSRFYYSDSISDFINKTSDDIIGKLTIQEIHDINVLTSNAWLEEIQILKSSLNEFQGRGSIFFEYNIPRMGRRADVILLLDGIVFIIEFKTSEQKFTQNALTQVWDYAIDLKNFHEGCKDRILIPIVLAPRLSKDQSSWQYYQLRSGTNWQNIKKEINREYQINAYRVLLTRARQGMVIVVPNGDNGMPPDETRKPEWYDGIYNYLKQIGIKELSD